MDGYDKFFGSGVQYYTSGRYAVFAGLVPVCGNLLHHAIEMCLKGALMKGGKSLQDLRKLGHDLNRIWVEFRLIHADAAFARFDDTVSALHSFEDLRYPDEVLARGARIAVNIKRTAFPFINSPGPEPSYELYLSDVDELMVAVFATASVNHQFFAAGLKQEAKEFLVKENIWAIGT